MNDPTFGRVVHETHSALLVSALVAEARKSIPRLTGVMALGGDVRRVALEACARDAEGPLLRVWKKVLKARS